MKRHSLWMWAGWWRQLPERWQQRMLAFCAGGLVAAVAWRLAGC